MVIPNGNLVPLELSVAYQNSISRLILGTHPPLPAGWDELC